MARRGNSEGSITKRKDGRWMARLTLSNGHRRAFYANTRQEAAQKLLKAQKAVSDGVPLPPERQSLDKYLEYWLIESVK